MTSDQIKTTLECHLVAQRAGHWEPHTSLSPHAALGTGTLMFIPVSCKYNINSVLTSETSETGGLEGNVTESEKEWGGKAALEMAGPTPPSQSRVT